MDPYTEYLGTGLARSHPSYRPDRPRLDGARAARRGSAPRANRWRLRSVWR